MNLPDSNTVRDLVELACRAPSVHNTQPWRWTYDGATLELFADTRRQLTYADPDRRDLIISCGAALHQLEVAAAAAGWASVVRRMPDPSDETLLASIRFEERPGTDTDRRLAQAITERRTDRRLPSSWPVPAGKLEQLAQTAQHSGVLAWVDLDGHQTVAIEEALPTAARLQNVNEAYLDELLAWTHSRDAEGIPTTNLLTRDAASKPPESQTRFPAGSLADEYDEGGAKPAPAWLVLSTSSDDALSWLRTGEALAAVWLSCTAAGLLLVPYTQATEVDTTRALLQREVLGDTSCPQILLRVGWRPPSRTAVEPTPRRAVDSVLELRDTHAVG